MLAQNFKSAADLQLTEEQRTALVKVLVLLETDKLRLTQKSQILCYGMRSDDERAKFSGFFNMDCWCGIAWDCGTVACIGGTAELIAGGPIFNCGSIESDLMLNSLFYPKNLRKRYRDITVEEASAALRSYLTTGDPNWKEVVGAK